MTTARIDDRASLERIYPREAFDNDARENARANNSVIHGMRVLSAPDSSGAFGVARARQHVGEGDPEGDTVFLAPALSGSQVGSGAGDGSGQEAGGDPVRSAGSGYDEFIETVLRVARGARFKRPIGKGEERLRGFHGG